MCKNIVINKKELSNLIATTNHKPKFDELKNRNAHFPNSEAHPRSGWIACGVSDFFVETRYTYCKARETSMASPEPREFRIANEEPIEMPFSLNRMTFQACP